MDVKAARRLRQRSTWAETLMWSWLRSRRFNGWKFRRQYPAGKYCLDFFCPEALLNVELDGFQHGFREQQKHDRTRQAFLDSLGVKTLRFWNAQLRRERQLVRDAIYRELQARASKQDA